jgi:hypothetical protein
VNALQFHTQQEVETLPCVFVQRPSTVSHRKFNRRQLYNKQIWWRWKKNTNAEHFLPLRASLLFSLKDTPKKAGNILSLEQ